MSTSSATTNAQIAATDGGAVVGRAGSCEAVATNRSHAIELLANSGLVNPIEDSGSRQMLSLEDITRSIGTGCVPQVRQKPPSAAAKRAFCSKRAPTARRLSAIISPTVRWMAPATICKRRWRALRFGHISGEWRRLAGECAPAIGRWAAGFCPPNTTTASASPSVSGDRAARRHPPASAFQPHCASRAPAFERRRASCCQARRLSTTTNSTRCLCNGVSADRCLATVATPSSTFTTTLGQFLSHDMTRTTLQPSANCPTCAPVVSAASSVCSRKRADRKWRVVAHRNRFSSRSEILLKRAA